jgi:hypothetical protein
MLRFRRASCARFVGPASGSRARDAEIYDHYAAGLYRQALLTLNDADLAEQVVCDVLVDECVRSPPDAADVASAGNASHRLAVSAYWRCQELAGHGRRDHPREQRPSKSPADCAGPFSLSRKERGALGLILFGGLSYVQASRELAISPPEMADLSRAALLRLVTAEWESTARNR